MLPLCTLFRLLKCGESVAVCFYRSDRVLILMLCLYMNPRHRTSQGSQASYIGDWKSSYVIGSLQVALVEFSGHDSA